MTLNGNDSIVVLTFCTENIENEICDSSNFICLHECDEGQQNKSNLKLEHLAKDLKHETHWCNTRNYIKSITIEAE